MNVDLRQEELSSMTFGVKDNVMDLTNTPKGLGLMKHIKSNPITVRTVAYHHASAADVRGGSHSGGKVALFPSWDRSRSTPGSLFRGGSHSGGR